MEPSSTGSFILSLVRVCSGESADCRLVSEPPTSSACYVVESVIPSRAGADECLRCVTCRDAAFRPCIRNSCYRSLRIRGLFQAM